jgi:hypothetical protein
MADKIKEAWAEVGEGFTDLVHRVSEHYGRLRPEQTRNEEQDEWGRPFVS